MAKKSNEDMKTIALLTAFNVRHDRALEGLHLCEKLYNEICAVSKSSDEYIAFSEALLTIEETLDIAVTRHIDDEILG